ncbi:MAG: DUF3367 domain-containing protein [Acidimicrobiales bacterium]|nr:DUF3367 domain-containing protein [Acidimicrobiales bacterium]
MRAEPARRPVPLRSLLEVAALAAIAYVPFLLSSPGTISSDSKQALYVDPGAFFVDAAHLWDPSVGAGAVPHQHLGYLWPMAPWFWAFDAVGAPAWIAQRLWLGTLTLVAALGARWLVRSLGLGATAAMAAALVYAATPYQLAFTARTSVLLLPWAGLPILVELTRRALDRGGWRHPALFALTTFTIAGVNAASLLLVGLAPLVVLATSVRDRAALRRAAATAGRIAALTLPACAWWLAGLRLQGAHGLPVLQLTEPLRTVADRSAPDDVLRGLGNWFFYGSDRAGWSIDQAAAYDSPTTLSTISFVLPAAALAVAVLLRWRDRLLAVAFVVGAAVVAVGAWPFDRPSPVGRLYAAFAEGSSLGLAFRNTPRVVPVLVLGMALLLAAGVAAAPERRRLAAGTVVGIVALAGIGPALWGGMLSARVTRPAEVPAAYREAAAALDAGDADTRVLALPGSNFAAYRWGNAIEPIEPLLLDRPYLTREVLPQGSAASALMVDALDRRLQNGTLDPASLAPVARLLGVGDILIRSDLEFERFGVVGPDEVWDELVATEVPGLVAGPTFGAPAASLADPALDPLTPDDLGGRATARDAALPPLAVLEVVDPEPIVRTDAVEGPIVLAGDADGIVDAAAAGVVDGHALVLLSGSLDGDALAGAVDDGAHLVVTDTDRRRAQSWFSSIVDTRGPTEAAGETIPEPSGTDARLQAFEADDDARTVAVPLGADATATAGSGVARPEDRPRAAIDGRPETSWRIGGADPTGEHLRIDVDDPRPVSTVTLLQPQDGPRDRTLTRVRLTVDGGESVDVDLDERSLEPPGQEVAIPESDLSHLDIELLATSDPGFDPALANAVGFAEVQIGDLEAAETVRLPVDLLDRVGPASLDHPLDVVLTRLRTDPDRWQRNDEEVALDRTFSLPTDRTFAVAGSVRPSTAADGPTLDDLLGTVGAVEVRASSHLRSSPDARPSRALDGDPETAWTSAFGTDRAPWLELVAPGPTTFDGVSLEVVADELHSLPAQVSVEVDGEVVATQALQLDADPEPGHREAVEVPFDAVEGTTLRLRIDELDARPSVVDAPGSPPLPVAIAEVDGTGLPPASNDPTIDDACRDDLVEVDGRPVPVRLGPVGADGTLPLRSCDPAALAAGDHRLRATDGAVSGVDVDALRLSSAAGGGPGDPTAVAGSPDGGPPASATTGRTDVRAEVDGADAPFWFGTGQSDDDGWQLDVEGGTAGPRTLVDGYGAGWRIEPDGGGPVVLRARWTPQRLVWAAMAISLATVAACLALVVRTRREAADADVDATDAARPTWRWPVGDTAPGAAGAVAAAAASTTLVVAAFSRPLVGVLAGFGAALAAWRPRAVAVLAVLAPASLVAARLATEPELAWLALGWVVAAVAAEGFRSRIGPRR